MSIISPVVAVSPEASKKSYPGRRKHPATADMSYSPRQLRYMKAVEEFKHQTGERFPTLCDLLQIADDIGSEN